METQTLQQTPAPDPEATQAFLDRVLTDTSAFLTVATSALGDRLGLFRELADCGPQTVQHVADCTGLHPRYLREWLNQMTAAGYLRHDAAKDTYELPPEHVPVLAQERGPMFLAGIHSYFVEKIRVFQQVQDAFVNGGGVPQSAYSERFYSDMDRFTSIWHENLLLQQFLPAAPQVVERLRAGITVADVGCGQGRAVIKMAQAFPASRFVGYDIHAPNVERARANAQGAGVGDRVRFETLDAAQGLPATYDLVTTFDVVHDAARPDLLLASIRKALRPGGHYLNLDINCQEDVEGNAGPLGALFYGASIFYCMTTSMAQAGAALGTVGLHEKKLAELAAPAGFRTVRKLPIVNPFNNLYLLEA